MGNSWKTKILMFVRLLKLCDNAFPQPWRPINSFISTAKTINFEFDRRSMSGLIFILGQKFGRKLQTSGVSSTDMINALDSSLKFKRTPLLLSITANQSASDKGSVNVVVTDTESLKLRKVIKNTLYVGKPTCFKNEFVFVCNFLNFPR